VNTGEDAGRFRHDQRYGENYDGEQYFVRRQVQDKADGTQGAQKVGGFSGPLNIDACGSFDNLNGTHHGDEEKLVEKEG
jgi:hypothetical protein